MPTSDMPSRPYRSAVRTMRARETRLAVIVAGAELFIELGYGPTTVDQIAARAGVGRATVFKAVGGKAALLCAAHRLAIVGVDDPRPPHEAGLTQRWAGVMGAVALLERYVAVVTDVFESVGPIHEVLAGCLGVRGTTRSARRPGPRAARGRYPDRAASR